MIPDLSLLQKDITFSDSLLKPEKHIPFLCNMLVAGKLDNELPGYYDV